MSKTAPKRGGFSQELESIEEMLMFSAPLKRLISEGQLIIRIRQIKQTKTKNFLKTYFSGNFGSANLNFMDEIFKVRKKYPVSANVKLTAFIK
jgi:hypothetical protein